MADFRVSLPAGRYFVGDVGSCSRPVVAVPARSSVFYDDEMNFEVEIAGGASSGFVDENAFSVFGVVEFGEAWGADFTDEDFEFTRGALEVTEPTEIIFSADYLEIVGYLKFSVARGAGLKFTSTDDEFEKALG